MVLSSSRTRAEVAEPTVMPPSPPTTSPPAARLRRPRWREWRTVVGLLLVVASVLLGVRVVAAADDTVPVLTAVADLAPGQPVDPTSFEVRAVGFTETEVAPYLDALPAEAAGGHWVIARPVAAGELVPRHALVAAGDLPNAAGLRHLTLSVPAGEAPPGLAPGSVVDVWQLPAASAEDRQARLVVPAAVVTAAAGTEDGLVGGSGQRKVTLAVTDSTVTDVEAVLVELLTAARDGLIYLTAVPAGPAGAGNGG